jgi:hypothetical protein
VHSVERSRAERECRSSRVDPARRGGRKGFLLRLQHTGDEDRGGGHAGRCEIVDAIGIWAAVAKLWAPVRTRRRGGQGGDRTRSGTCAYCALPNLPSGSWAMRPRAGSNPRWDSTVPSGLAPFTFFQSSNSFPNIQQIKL